MVGARVDLRAVEVSHSVEARVVGQIHRVGGEGIICEAWILEHAAMEDEFKHQWVRPIPTVRAVMGFLAEAMVGQVGAKVIEERVFGAVGEQIEVEACREPPDVDPTVVAVHYCVRIKIGGLLRES